MSDVIANSHFKSFNRLYPMTHKQHPNMTKKEVMEEIKKKYHDRHLKMTQKRPYMVRIFDPVIGCYFHDLLQQTSDRPDGYPHYFHIFIESNSRYAFAYPVNSKTTDTAIQTLDRFIQDNHGKPIVKLTSDGESAFDSKEFKDYCKSLDIYVRIINDRAHSSLGLIDRFIRTIRDLHQPIRRGEPEQRSVEMDNFSEQEMTQLINEYNNTFHKTIGCSPAEMYNNPELEREWIRKRQKFQTIQKNIKDFEIPIGSYVRYRMNSDDLAGGKRRSQFSLEKYRVIKRVGNRYVLQSTDSNGGFITKSRFELILADDSYPYGKTFYRSQTVVPDIVDTNFDGSFGLKWSEGSGWH